MNFLVTQNELKQLHKLFRSIAFNEELIDQNIFCMILKLQVCKFY
jgi:hypothetical protein